MKPLSHGAFGMVFSIGKHQCEGNDPLINTESAIKLNFDDPSMIF